MTILPQIIESKLTDFYKNFNESTSDWNNYVKTAWFSDTNVEDQILGYTSGINESNIYGYINHIHTQHEINSAYNSEIPNGTLILYPVCFKYVKNSKDR